MKYRIEKYIEKSLILFWGLLPNKWLFWAVNEAWARATARYYTDKQPDEITWSMMQKLLSRPSTQAPGPRDIAQVPSFGMGFKTGESNAQKKT